MLDLGAGEGKQAEFFARVGIKVTAVDQTAPPVRLRGVDWHVCTVESFLASLNETDTYDIIFNQNLIQFLSKEFVTQTFFPTLTRHLAPDGLMATRTFWRDPVPPFKQACASLYMLEELLPHFTGWNILLQRQFDYRGKDLREQERQFYITDVIAKRNS